ncbi:AzlD domain-containing protein [Halarchaeum sp. P4]|uniref:AzlD domain-containing protein n=1 Tax=Halarchaeum sp. P4 TaxID=3421639 RepID=UPI003EB8B086
MTTYNALTIWAVILAIAIPTFLVRYSFIGLFGRLGEAPDWVERVLAFVPAAVLAALVVPDVVTIQSTVAATLGQDRVLAGVVAAVVAWRTENVFATIAVGMLALWTVRFVLPMVL